MIFILLVNFTIIHGQKRDDLSEDLIVPAFTEKQVKKGTLMMMDRSNL